MNPESCVFGAPSLSKPYYNRPEWYGARGDGTTDDGAALNLYFAANTDIKLTPGKTYYTTVPLLVPYTCRSFDMTGAKIIFNTSVFGTTSSVLTFGDTAHFHDQPSIKGVWVENTGSMGAWSGNAGNACVRFYNTIAGQIEILYVRGATIGIQLVGETAGGVYYNTFRLGKVVNNQYGLDLRSNTANIGVNQNTFIGGELQITGSTNVNQDAAAIRYSYGSGGYEGHNNNFHYNFSSELALGGSGVRTPVYMNCGGYNYFAFRAETFTDYAVRCIGNAANRHNKFEVGYLSGGITGGDSIYDTSPEQTNVFSWVGKSWRAQIPGYQSPQLAQAVYHYNATDIGIRGVGIATSAGGAYASVTHNPFAAGLTGITPHFSHVEIGAQRALFVEIDTTVNKKFVVYRCGIGTSGGRVRIAAYDSSGVNLSGGSDVVGLNLSGGASYGYSYGTASDSFNDVIFAVTSSVAKIRVLFAGGTASALLSSFAIQKIGGDTVTPMTVSADLKFASNDSIMAAATAPTTWGFYRAGTFIQNDGATTARTTGLIGWTADADGGLAPLWVTAKAYAVGDLAYFGTHIYRCSTAGTSGGSGPTGTSASSPVSDGGASWLYVCELITFTAQYAADQALIGTVSTTDATVTTVLTIPITTNAQTTVMVMVAGRRTGGSAGAAADGASYIRGVSVKDNAGTPTIIGSSAMMTDQESQAGWDVTFDISTTNLRVRVTGAANNNIDWKASARILSVT